MCQAVCPDSQLLDEGGLFAELRCAPTTSQLLGLAVLHGRAMNAQHLGTALAALAALKSQHQAKPHVLAAARALRRRALAACKALEPGSDGGTYLCTERGAEGRGYSASMYCNLVSPQGGQELVEETLTALREIHAQA